MTESAPLFSSSDSHPPYRACTIEEAGRALSSFAVEAADDAEAIWIASAFGEVMPVMLWHGERFLGRFDGPIQGPTARHPHTLR